MKLRTNTTHQRTAKRQKGATLIEVLVAVLILSFGLLGMAALQIRALKGNHSSTQRSQAVMASYYIIDAMRVDKTSAVAGDYNFDECSAPAAGSSLSSVNLNDWMVTLKANIGQPTDTTTCGKITCDATGVCTVVVKWDDTRAGGLGAQTLETKTQL
jgi:type IV pilus assembly protein PilV